MSAYQLLQEVDTLSKNLRKYKHSTSKMMETKVMKNGKLARDQAERGLQVTRRCALILGCIVGGFLECAVLGACFVLNHLAIFGGHEKYAALDADKGCALVILVWCFGTGTAAAVLGVMLRKMVWTLFHTTYRYVRPDEPTRQMAEKLVDKITTNVDTSFGLGCLLGMSFFWFGTYLVFGLEDIFLVVQFCVLMSLALAIWVFMIGGPGDSEFLDKIFAELESAIAKEGHLMLETKKSIDPPTGVETAVPFLLV